MATVRPKPKTVKLVYEDSKIPVKANDIVQSSTLGEVTVVNIRSSRKKHGHGRITLQLADGRKGDYPPGDIQAVWVQTT